MKCACGAVMPFVEEQPTQFDCVFCDKTQYPQTTDLLSQLSLGLVKEVRDGQIALSESVEDSILTSNVAMFEAGTGVGKSFAYLLPAILMGKRVVISTAKITLQNQLVDKDLPYLKAFLTKIGHPKAEFNFFCAYGKSKYACYKKANEAFHGKPAWKPYEKLFLKSKYALWEDAYKMRLKVDQSYSAEDCIGVNCTFYSKCQYIAARRAMASADIVVTNNWLLGYHYRVQQENSQIELLGPIEHLIVDEAHKIEDGIRSAFTNETKLNNIDNIIKNYEAVQELCSVFPDLADLDILKAAWDVSFNDLINTKSNKRALPNPEVLENIKHLISVLQNIINTVISSVEIPQVMTDQNSAYRFKQYLTTMYMPAAIPVSEQFDKFLFETPTTLAINKLLSSLQNGKTVFDAILQPPPNRVWDITNDTKNKSNYVLQSIPVNIGSYLPKKGVTYLSATLAIDKTFDAFATRVGHSQGPSTYVSNIFESPFNIQKQSWLYVASEKSVPAPPRSSANDSDKLAYRDAISNQILELIYANKGDALVLFTATEELKHVAAYLKSKAFPYPVFTQGEFTPVDALAQYRVTPHSTILGLKSFWEGIDITGEKLSLIIIPKLPFPVPNDPIIAARKAQFSVEARSFMHVDFPEMMFDLRQGVGRLIRSKTDKGVIAILDSRLTTKRYKVEVLRTLGLQPYHDLQKVCKGLASRHAR